MTNRLFVNLVMLYNHFVYIVTNQYRTTLYVGVTNNIQRRLEQHCFDSQNAKKSFAGKYNCIYLMYYEGFEDPKSALIEKNKSKNGAERRKTSLFQSLTQNGKF